MKLANIPKSPFARHPRLLLRKCAERLGRQRNFAFVPDRAPHARLLPHSSVELLRHWAASLEPDTALYPHERVYGTEFKRRDLNHLCESGALHLNNLQGDIKTIWEYSRGHGLVLNSIRADEAHREPVARNGAMWLRDWMEHNTIPAVPAWINAMENALRAVNWIVANSLLEGALREYVGTPIWDNWIWNHGRSVEHQLECRLIPSNHYLANLLGLAYLGYSTGHEPWRTFGTQEFQAALLQQTHADGGLYEASLPYHGLVTEMALLFKLLVGDAALPAFNERLTRMCAVVADMRSATGDLYQVGDNDSGRVIPIDFISGYGRAQALQELARRVLGHAIVPATEQLYPQSGWWVCSAGLFRAHLEFGGVGLAGFGAHAHNDQLSACLDYDGLAIFVDPGSYLYTPAPEARNRFRGTAMHNTVMLDGKEQLPLPSGHSSDLFFLPGPDKPAALLDARPGQVSAQAQFARTIHMTGAAVIIEDVLPAFRKTATWHFHLHPSVQPRPVEQGMLLESCGRRLLLKSQPGLALEITDSEYSAMYGHSSSTKALRAIHRNPGQRTVRWSITAT